MQEIRSYFFQFPLCLIQGDLDPHELTQDICAWTLVDKGLKWFGENVENIGPTASALAVQDFASLALEKGTYASFCAENEMHLAIVEAIRRMPHLKAENLDCTVNRYHRIATHVDAYEYFAEGRDAHVRIRADLIWEQLNRGKMPLREFRVLCGFYAAIGRKPYMRISLNWLQYLAAGFKSAKAFAQAEEGGTETKFLSVDQLRRTRDKLEALGWLVSFYDGRRCYYSHRLSMKQLAEKIVEAKSYQLKKKKERKMLQAEARNQLDALKKEVARLG